MTKFFNEPLAHFLAGGALLYIALGVFSPAEEADNSVITVDEPALLQYLQYQDKAFDTNSAQNTLASLDTAAKDRLKEEYVRDEVMVREALALGLDDNDEVIRGRLIQKMDFILQGFADHERQVSETEVTAYYSANKKKYTQEATTTLTHVFFSAEKHGMDEAKAQAAKLLGQLNSLALPFEKAGEYGERFYFLRNYVGRPQSMIIAHFGSEMSDEIFSREAGNSWFGPVQSKYGSHLVLLKEIAPARIPELSEVAGQILSDIRREQLDEARREALSRLTQKYQISIPAEGN